MRNLYIFIINIWSFRKLLVVLYNISILNIKVMSYCTESYEEISKRIKRTNFVFYGSPADKRKKTTDGSYVYIPSYENGGYVAWYDRILDKFINKTYNMNASTFRVLCYIARNIGFNTNIINITQRGICNALHITLKTVNEAIDELQSMNLLLRYGNGKYLVNHNYIFRGDLRQFYEDYKFLYPDQEGEIF